jgi:hypothetical protein
MCTAARYSRAETPPPPPHLGSYYIFEGPTGQPRWTTSLCDPARIPFPNYKALRNLRRGLASRKLVFLSGFFRLLLRLLLQTTAVEREDSSCCRSSPPGSASVWQLEEGRLLLLPPLSRPAYRRPWETRRPRQPPTFPPSAPPVIREAGH